MKTSNKHRLLERQIQKFLPKNVDRNELSAFLQAVGEAYDGYDEDLEKFENILDQSSREMARLNNQLKEKAEQKSAIAKELSDRISAVVNNIQEIVFQTDAAGRWTYLNPAFERISGFTVAECLGKSFTEIVYPGDLDFSKKKFQDLLNRNQTTAQFTLRFLTKDFEIRWAEAFITFEKDEFGAFKGASGLLNDITKRYEAEEKLKKTNLNLAEAQELARLGSWEYRAENLREGYWTDEVYKILGIEKRAEFNLPVEELYRNASPSNAKKAEELINRCLKTGEAGEVRYKVSPGGKEKWLLLRAKPEFNEAQNVTRLVGTLLDITQQIEIEKELTQAKRTAEKALAAKSEFLSNMSHEIRTPMNAIMGLTNLLMQEEDISDDIMENLKLIGYSAENLLVLINDILDYSKIEANKIEFEKIEFNLRDVIEKLLRTMRLKAEEKGLNLRCTIDSSIPESLMGDPYRLNQILMNLLSNALKFTKKGKVEIEVSQLSSDGKKVNLKFEVKDTGIGISKEKQERIFDSFTQANSETTRSFGGTGLGLAISKRLVQLQGGKIELQSELGEGSCFSIYINYKLGEGDVNKPSVQKNQATMASNFENIKMLVAEDNMVNQKLLQQICKQWHLDPIFVEDGKLAIDKCLEEEFDIILMDLQMPKINGFEATERICNDESSLNRKTPIIALTADAFQETKNKVMKSGFTGYVGKPYKAEELKETILNSLQKNGRQKAGVVR